MRPSVALCALFAMNLIQAAYADDRPVDESPKPVSVSVGYLGEFAFHPGLEVGVDAVLARSSWGWGDGDFVLAGNLGGYAHLRNHTGLFVDAEAGYRLTFRPGFLVEAFAGVGYLHTFLGAPTWVVDDHGPKEVVDLGRPAFMPIVGLGFGWQFAKVAPFLRLETFGQYPFNNNLLPHLAVQIGARF